MSSMGGQLSFAGFGAYSGTKFALEGMSEALADVRRGVVISTPSARYKAASALLRAVPRSVVRAVGKYR